MTKFEMLEKVKKVFNERLENDMRTQNLLALMQSGEATQEHAAKYAQRIGDICSDSLKSIIGDVESLPGGVLPEEYAEYLLNDRLRHDHDLIVRYADTVQNSIYQTQGLGVQCIDPDFSDRRIKRLVKQITGSTPEELEYWFGDPIVSFDARSFDRWVKKNLEAVYNAGYSAFVVRTTGPAITKTYKEIRPLKHGNGTYTHTRTLPCGQCQKVAGKYPYGDEPDQFYKRHEGCRCLIIYTNGNVITNVNQQKEADDTIKARAAYNLDITKKT